MDNKPLRRRLLANHAAIKKLAHQNGKRVSAGFLAAVELAIHTRILAACKMHNGGRKTIDREVALYSGFKPFAL